MDLLESGDERDPVSPAALARRVPPWVVALAAAAALVAGLVAAIDQRREAARPDVAVRLLDARSSTVAGVAQGTLELLLVNRRDRPARLGGLAVEVEGLQVTALRPEPSGALRAYGEQRLRVEYTVPSCAELVLPGALVLRVDDEQQRVSVFDPRDGQVPGGIGFGGCPPSARGERPGEPTDLGARSAGGTADRVGAGAAGSARLEIRNGGPPVRLLSVSAHVPGALFVSRLIDGGLTLETDGLALVSLAFSVRDCDRLEKTGALVIRIERFGGVQELRLPVSSGLSGDAGPQVDLRVVLDSCD